MSVLSSKYDGFHARVVRLKLKWFFKKLIFLHNLFWSALAGMMIVAIALCSSLIFQKINVNVIKIANRRNIFFRNIYKYILRFPEFWIWEMLFSFLHTIKPMLEWSLRYKLSSRTKNLPSKCECNKASFRRTLMDSDSPENLKGLQLSW